VSAPLDSQHPRSTNRREKHMAKQAKKGGSILAVGSAVFVRTVTHNYTGRITAVDAQWIHLDDAAWIADSDRGAAALATGKLAEVEPYPGSCVVAVGAVVDISPWLHALPREVK